MLDDQHGRAGYLVSTATGRAAGNSYRLRAYASTLLWLVTAAFAGLLAVRSFWAAAAFLALAGLAGGSFLQLQRTTMQRNAPDHLLGRISAAYASITMAVTLTGALLAAITVNQIGRTDTMAFAITVIGCAAATALLLPARRASAVISCLFSCPPARLGRFAAEFPANCHVGWPRRPAPVGLRTRKVCGQSSASLPRGRAFLTRAPRGSREQPFPADAASVAYKMMSGLCSQAADFTQI